MGEEKEGMSTWVVSLSVSLFLSVYVCLPPLPSPVWAYHCLSCLSVSMHVCLSVCLCLYVSVCVCLSPFPSPCVSHCLSDCCLSDSQSFIQPLAQCSLCRKDIRNKKQTWRFRSRRPELWRKTFRGCHEKHLGIVESPAKKTFNYAPYAKVIMFGWIPKPETTWGLSGPPWCINLLTPLEKMFCFPWWQMLPNC